MPYQTSGNVVAAIKREVSTTPGVAAASGAGATRIRIIDSGGLELTRSAIQSQERRPSGMKAMGRLGGKSVAGGFASELSVGGHVDMALEAIIRGVWSAALVITEATASAGALTVNATNQITRTGGSWITDGIRVGDVVTLTNYSTAADNDLRLRVTVVTALVLTFAGNPLTVGASDAAWTLTRLKKLVSPTTPTRYSHTVDQYDADPLVDLSELFLGCRLTSVALSFRPNAVATMTTTYVGMDRLLLVSGTSPWFTTPALTTGASLIADDSAIRFNGADVASFNSFDLDFAIDAAGSPVIGSFVSPDIFDNDLTISGTISGLRSDFSKLILFDAETEFEAGILLREPGVAPVGALAINLLRVKLASVAAPFGGGDGPKVETYSLMVGERDAASGLDAGGVQIFSTAA